MPVTVATSIVRFICLRFSVRFFRQRRRLYATEYEQYVFSFLRSPCVFFRRQTRTVLAETLWRSYGNRTDIVQSSCNLHNLRTKSHGQRCPCDVLAGSLRLSQEHTIIFGPKCLSKIVRCPCDQRVVPVRDKVSKGSKIRNRYNQVH